MVRSIANDVVEPGQKLEVNFRAATLEQTIHTAGRRLALGVVAGAALLGTAIMSTSDRISGWVPAALGAVGMVFTIVLLWDLVRRRK